MARSSSPRRAGLRVTVEGDVAPERAHVAVVVPVEGLDPARDAGRDLRSVRRWFPPLSGADPALLAPAPRDVALVVGPDLLALHVGSDDRGFEVTGTHGDDRVVDAARSGPIAVYLVEGTRLRRGHRGELEEAARRGALAGALVAAFAVDAL